jgi:antitoxin component of RelBE/YafQ-DinJ toxin-antitoxin module
MQRQLITRFRGDSHFSVSRTTWKQVAKKLNMSEADAIHYALAKVAGELIKDFPFDDIPDSVTLKGIETTGKSISKLTSSYFAGENHEAMENSSPSGRVSVVPVS